MINNHYADLINCLENKKISELSALLSNLFQSDFIIGIATGSLFKQKARFGNKIWNFDSTGNVVFPDSTTQTTSYPGTSTTLSLTGNISSGNANLGNLTTSNYFHGVFDNTSSSQPNITGVGNLSNLTVGNISLLLNCFILYFVNRLLYTMCVKSLI